MGNEHSIILEFKKQDGNNWDLSIISPTADIDNVSSKYRFLMMENYSDPQSITIETITFQNGAAEIQNLNLDLMMKILLNRLERLASRLLIPTDMVQEHWIALISIPQGELLGSIPMDGCRLKLS